MARKTLILGVDPGYKTGAAMVDVRGPSGLGLPVLKQVKTCPGKDALAVIGQMYGDPETVFCAVQTPIMAGKTARWHRGDRSGIGLVKNAALAHEIIGWLKGRGFDVVAVPPGRSYGMKSKALFNAAFGGRIPKCRISEHARDAAMLALHADGLQALKEGGGRAVEKGKAR